MSLHSWSKWNFALKCAFNSTSTNINSSTVHDGSFYKRIVHIFVLSEVNTTLAAPKKYFILLSLPILTISRFSWKCLVHNIKLWNRFRNWPLPSEHLSTQSAEILMTVEGIGLVQDAGSTHFLKQRKAQLLVCRWTTSVYIRPSSGRSLG
jgi:hypothetical protein